MFSEPTERHHVPHFHAYYQEHVAIFRVEPVELIAGSVPQRQQRLVEAWAELHKEELLSASTRRLRSCATAFLPLPL